MATVRLQRGLLHLDSGQIEGTSIKQKIETIAMEIYGADGCDYSEEAEKIRKALAG